jgi:hypothetical protein
MIVGFLVPAPDLGRAGTQDMIVGSAICCMCPAAMALVAAIVLWVLAVRRK